MKPLASEMHIRILDILPSDDESAEIRCEIRTASLSDGPKYEAVSYARGNDSADLLPIDVSGRTIEVTRTLHAALRRFRRRREPRALWIDQLCADPDAAGEDALLLLLPPSRYFVDVVVPHCAGCLIWLGDVREDIPRADAAAAVDFLRWLEGEYHFSRETADRAPPACMGSAAAARACAGAIRSIGVLECPWWWDAAAWTVQAALRRATLHWDRHALAWETLRFALDQWWFVEHWELGLTEETRRILGHGGGLNLLRERLGSLRWAARC
ncbi:hypothetical protein F5Y12DRAFT_231843 [Xylaria sp. FL1777]|nr:hypothetical protein F5Y12DRAFT_231843 [Xylaria sp. FL1777]